MKTAANDQEMKCPKCGWFSLRGTDEVRCRTCGYQLTPGEVSKYRLYQMLKAEAKGGKEATSGAERLA